MTLDTILEYEKFKQRLDAKGNPHHNGVPRYNNFWTRFDEKWDDVCADDPHRARLYREHPALVARVRGEVARAKAQYEGFKARKLKVGIANCLGPAEPALYEAYIILVGYGASHKDLSFQTFPN